MSINNEQAAYWISQLEKDVKRIKKMRGTEKKITLIREQYKLLVLIPKAVEGSVNFIGVPPIT